MNALYGISDTKVVKNTEAELSCPKCNTDGSTEIIISISYLHIFGIPFMPFAKKGHSECNSCTLKLDHNAFEEPIKEHFNGLVSKMRTPIKLYTLTIILSLLMVAVIAVSVAITSNDGLNLLDQPKKQDSYVFAEKKGELEQWTIDRIEADSISFSSYNKESEGIIVQKFSKEDLLKMKADDKLVKIIRP